MGRPVIRCNIELALTISDSSFSSSCNADPVFEELLITLFQAVTLMLVTHLAEPTGNVLS